MHMAEEARECAGPFGKLEAIEQFIARQRRAPADHMAQVQLGEFVVGEIEHAKTMFAKRVDQGRALIATGGLHADEDMRFGGIADAVIEFGNAALAQRRAEAKETA